MKLSNAAYLAIALAMSRRILAKSMSNHRIRPGNLLVVAPFSDGDLIVGSFDTTRQCKEMTRKMALNGFIGRIFERGKYSRRSMTVFHSKFSELISIAISFGQTPETTRA